MLKRMAMVSTLVFSLASSFALAADRTEADTVAIPSFTVNDSWTYRVTNRMRTGETKERHYVLSIVRASSDSIVISAKATDSSLPPVENIRGADMSQVASIKGREVLVNKPFDFPLQPGKKWTVAYERENPNKVLKLYRLKLQYKAVGWEKVTVPAGSYRAFKVEAEGNWYNEFNPTPATAGAVSKLDASGSSVIVKNEKAVQREPVIGKVYRTYWYVPALKREVKTVEEEYSTQGSLSARSTWELESSSLAETK